MLSVTWGQRSKTVNVIGQVIMSWAWIIVITHIHRQTAAGAENRCADGVCGYHDSRLMAQHDQPISDTQVN